MVSGNRVESLPGSALEKGSGPRKLAAAGAQLAFVVAAPLVAAMALVAFEDVSELGSAFVVTVAVVAIAVFVAMLFVGLGGLHRAEAQTKTAIDRAAAAEAAQRARADELARVLAASESLAFTGEGQVDYLGVLAAITPDDATSFLVRIDGGTDATVVAAHGPLAASVVGMTRPLPSPETDPELAPAPLASYSASGHTVGRAMPRTHFGDFEADVESALSIRLVDHGGRCMGWLHLLDHHDERILEPSFVGLAQLVGNQIGVAMENNALLARVRHQLVEVQRVQQQLVQATKLSAVGELAAAVAHEVNNPLTGILGFSELLVAELPQGDPRHDEAAVIRDAAVRARSIVRALLEFARPRPPQRIPTNLNDLARATVELVRFRASEAGVRIHAEYAELPSLEIDPDAFRQVLLNLLNNAIDAMPDGGELRVTTIDEGERVGLVVADAGVGMDEVTLDRIFTPFFSTRAGTGGAGLGLSVSLQIVEGHGGTIEVESVQGHGSVFSVWLPRSWPAFDGAVLVPGLESQSVPENGTSASPEAAVGEEPLSSKKRKVAA